MAFDFPNSPSVGQRVTGVGGIVYVWDGVKWASNIGSVTAQSMGDIGRNLLHNPLFAVAQRGYGPWTTTSYTLDRWALFTSLDTTSASVPLFSDAQRTAIGDEEAVYALSVAVTGNAGAGAYTFLAQSIENVRRLANKTVTVSLWAYALAGTPKIGAGLRQSFGTGGSPSAVVDLNATPITLSTTPTRYSVTVALPSTAGKTLGTNNDHCTRLALFLSSGANTNVVAGGIGVQSATFVFWGVQLEIGSVATPLEKPDPRYDLANCQRFYQVGYSNLMGYGIAGGGVAYQIPWPVTMRGIPTVIPTVLTGTNITGGSLTVSPNALGCSFNGTATTTATFQLTTSYTASADL